MRNVQNRKQLVSRIVVALSVIAASLAGPALADSITSINGVSVTSINEGSVTASGSFGRTTIAGGRNNFVGVTSTGAVATAQIVKDGTELAAPGNDTVGVSSISASNKGAVTATGTFNGGTISGSNNSVGVSAAGTSVNISIIHR